MAKHEPVLTTNLDLAAYLCAIGHELMGTEAQGRFIAFLFSTSASADAEKFLTGAPAPAKAVLECYRQLRTIITNHERRTEKVCPNKSVIQ